MCGHGNPHEVSPKYLYNVCVAMVTLMKLSLNLFIALVNLIILRSIFIMNTGDTSNARQTPFIDE